MTGRVVLVGGGPGDPGLMTLRGMEALRQADVVVVDRLAPRELLMDLDPRVEVVDVGKLPGHHAVPQDRINELLVTHAQAGRVVVRLKGGDPFVLGRGGEEWLACRAAGVPVEVVPGVTSAVSVPAAAGIPVTHRGLSSGVMVVTGHDGVDCDVLARWRGTLVVLMGVAHLRSLSERAVAAGVDPATPVAVVERGCSAAQRTTRARLDEVAEVCERVGVSSPAVVVVGSVAVGLDALAAAGLAPAGPVGAAATMVP